MFIEWEIINFKYVIRYHYKNRICFKRKQDWIWKIKCPFAYLRLLILQRLIHHIRIGDIHRWNVILYLTALTFIYSVFFWLTSLLIVNASSICLWYTSSVLILSPICSNLSINLFKLSTMSELRWLMLLSLIPVAVSIVSIFSLST